MTAGELKFALQVESVLNSVPEPEYRQMIVEALTTLTIFSEMNASGHFINDVISVNGIVDKAHQLFLADQVMKHNGCCLSFSPFSNSLHLTQATDETDHTPDEDRSSLRGG